MKDYTKEDLYMIKNMLNWVDENEDLIIERFEFGFAICVALGMMSLQFIL